MPEYSILARLKIDTTAADAYFKNPRTLPVKAKMADTASIDNQIQRWQNSLAKMQSTKPTVFASADVQSAVKNFESLYDGFRKGTVTTDTMRTKLDDVRTAMTRVSGAMQQNIKDGDSFSRSIGKDILKVAEWAVATGILFGALKKLQEGIQYVKDLNVEMTNLGMVTGQSTDQLAGMATDFNDMAKELGVTTLDVAKGSVEWVRAGKSVAETNLLLVSSTKLSKLGNMEAADATDKLIAATNAYNISAQDSIKFVDVLVNLDNNFATSTNEIATAMQKSSSMAKLAGVNYQDLASYITVVSSITRQSGDTIGQAFKTIFARMEQVKAGANIDDEGESINNVEKVLLKNGIALRDNANQFRDMSDVLKDVAEKYKELQASGDTVAQQQIVGAIAGKIRMPEHIVICG